MIMHLGRTNLAAPDFATQPDSYTNTFGTD